MSGDEPKLLGVSKNTSLTFAVAALGPPGSRTMLHVAPRFEGQPEEVSRAWENDTSERRFLVSGLLSKFAGGLIDQVKTDFSEHDGASYLHPPRGSASAMIEVLGASFVMKANERGEISMVEFACTARDPLDAMLKFLQTVYLGLDHLSYRYNVPVFIQTIKIYDTVHKTTHVDIQAPPRNIAER